MTCRLDHSRKRLHDLTFGMIDVLQLVEKQIVERFELGRHGGLLGRLYWDGVRRSGELGAVDELLSYQSANVGVGVVGSQCRASPDSLALLQPWITLLTRVNHVSAEELFGDAQSRDDAEDFYRQSFRC